jgi:hypothetical protein
MRREDLVRFLSKPAKSVGCLSLSLFYARRMIFQCLLCVCRLVEFID